MGAVRGAHIPQDFAHASVSPAWLRSATHASGWPLAATVMGFSERHLMIGGSLLRLTYASGLLLAPKSMSRWRLIGPDPRDPYARMTTRAFGALHSNLALQTIRSAIQNRDVGFVLALNLTSDIADTLGPTLEWRYGDLPTIAALGNAAVQSAGLITWSALLWRRGAASRQAKLGQ